MTIPAGGTGFNFTTDIPGYDTFTLDDGEIQVMSAKPGNRAIIEIDPAPVYDLTGIECLVFDPDPKCATVTVPGDLATGKVDLKLTPGQAAFCSFINTKRAVSRS